MIQIDMEMPTDCNICPCCQSNVHFTHFTCGITEDDVVDDETGEIFKDRPSWCPLKEVQILWEK